METTSPASKREWRQARREAINSLREDLKVNPRFTKLSKAKLDQLARVQFEHMTRELKELNEQDDKD